MFFWLMQLADQRLVQTNGTGKCDPKLELVINVLFPGISTRVVTLRAPWDANRGRNGRDENENAKKSSSANNSIVSSDSDDEDDSMGSSGGTHTTSSRDEKKPQTAAQRKRAMYLRMFELMGLGNHKVVVNMLVTKVCNNMKFWASNKEVISKSLNVFFWLVGYGGGRFMLTLDSVKYLLTHQVLQHLPFLDLVENTKSRTTFYKTLTRLVF